MLVMFWGSFCERGYKGRTQPVLLSSCLGLMKGTVMLKMHDHQHEDKLCTQDRNSPLESILVTHHPWAVCLAFLITWGE